MKLFSRTGMLDRCLLVAWLVLALVPINFVSLRTPIAAVYDAALAVSFGSLAALLVARVWVSRALLAAVALVGLVMALNLTIAPHWQVVPKFMGILIAGGLFASRTPQRALRALLQLHVVSAVALLAELIVHRHFVSGLFGTAIMPPDLAQAFRARGLTGHPVPAGILGVVFGTVLVAYRNGFRRSGVVVLVVLAAEAVDIVATGTRSALVLAMIGLALVALADVRSGLKPRPMVIALVAISSPMLLFVLQQAMEALSGSRVGSFAGISQTQSWQVRSQAGLILDMWKSRCAGSACEVVGSGYGDLLQTLRGGAIISQVSTVDNSYISILWDYGLLGLGLIVLPLALWAGRVYVFRPSGAGAAVGLLLILGAGFLFDTLYTAQVLVACSLLMGLLMAGHEGWPELEVPQRASEVVAA